MEEEKEELNYNDLMSKLSVTPTSNSRFKNIMMQELARRERLSSTKKTRPPPPIVPPPDTSSPLRYVDHYTKNTSSIPPVPPSSFQTVETSLPSTENRRNVKETPLRFQTIDHRKETHKNMLEIKRLRAELSLSKQISANRGLRCLFEKLTRRECEKRMKTLNRDQRVHELEAMILKRDTKIEKLNRELNERSKTSEIHFHDTMQSIQIETSKTIENIKSTAIRAAKSSEQRHKKEIEELTRRKDAEIEMLRAQVLKFHSNMEEMSRNNTSMVRQSRATGARELSLAKSELQSVKSNLEVSRAKCEMLERNIQDMRKKFESERVEMKQEASMSLKQATDELERFRVKNSNLEQKIELHGRENESKLKDLEHLLKEKDNLLKEKDNQTHQAVKHAAEMVLGEVQRATESSKRESDSLRSRVRDLEIERVRLQTRLEDTTISLENQRDVCSERENELKHVQNQHLELSRDYENQIRGLHDLLVERDQQVQRLGEILQQEMAATDVETGATPRIEDLVDRVRHMQDAVASIVASHFEETSPSSKRAQPSKRGKDDDQVPKKVLSPQEKNIKSALKMSFNRADEIHRRHLKRLKTPLK